MVWGGGTRVGYFRTVLLAVRAALEAEEPIFVNTAVLQCDFELNHSMKSLGSIFCGCLIVAS